MATALYKGHERWGCKRCYL